LLPLELICTRFVPRNASKEVAADCAASLLLAVTLRNTPLVGTNGSLSTLYPSTQNSSEPGVADAVFIAVSWYALTPATDSAATIEGLDAFTGERLTSE